MMLDSIYTPDLFYQHLLQNQKLKKKAMREFRYTRYQSDDSFPAMVPTWMPPQNVFGQ